MTGELVRVDGRELAVSQGETPDGLPEMSAEMARMIGYFNERNRLFRMPEVTPELRSEAQKLMELVRAAAAPVSEAKVRSWLAPINMAIARPLEGKDFTARAAAIGEALAGLPVACFTKATRAQAMRSFQWFPSAAELSAMLTGRTSAVREALRALDAFARPPAKSSGRAIEHDRGTRPDSKVERDRIIERFHGQMRERGPQAAAEVFDPARLTRHGFEGAK